MKQIESLKEFKGGNYYCVITFGWTGSAEDQQTFFVRTVKQTGGLSITYDSGKKAELSPTNLKEGLESGAYYSSSKSAFLKEVRSFLSNMKRTRKKRSRTIHDFEQFIATLP
ncbi:MAG TPA: hypothetical protein VN420_01890 [Candidatus Fimivivens sp.]|nr:hypothetical protein [Candidatus Fimivivens sp.]